MVEANSYRRDERKRFTGSLEPDVGELREMPIFLPEYLAQVDAGQLHLLAEGREANQLVGQPWGAVKIVDKKSR